MLALRLEHFAIGLERGQHGRCLSAGDAGQHGLRFLELPRRAVLAGDWLGELIKRVRRRGALSLEQRIVNGLDLAEPMHLIAADLEVRHAGEGAHLRDVFFYALFCSGLRGRLLVASLTPGQHDGSGHAFQIPLEWAADGLVEVVDVEDEPSVRRGKGAQVAHMRVTAELADDASIGQHGQVGGHHRHCAAKVAEGRRGHQLVFEFDQRWHTTMHRPIKKEKRRDLARFDVQLAVRLASNLFAPRVS